MQLRSRTIIIIIFSFASLFAQDKKETEIDFLLNYYDQDGNNSAVTGGKGTEQLTNTGAKIIINIPADNNKSYNISISADSYTSASSNNIDPVRSGASGHDLHSSGNFEYNVELPESSSSFGISAGLSNEFDYSSFSAGGRWSINSTDKNQTISISTMNFFDRVSLIYPIELRRRGKLLSDNTRQTYSLSLIYDRVINKRLQLAIMTDIVYQTGLLSTPFNRVYFQNSNEVDVERLPGKRFKFPAGLRINYFLSEIFVPRLHYRYYWDTFGISAHSLSMELAIRLNQTLAIIPFTRYHLQSKTKYFEPYAQHDFQDKFYTSDYDLSSFNSLKAGLGIRYYPLEFIADIPGLLHLKRIDFRAGWYNRSDGLSAYNITAGFSFILP